MVSDKLIISDFLDTYVLGIKLISGGFYGSAQSCIDCLVMDRIGFPFYEPILTEYIVTLEQCLKEKKSEKCD